MMSLPPLAEPMSGRWARSNRPAPPRPLPQTFRVNCTKAVHTRSLTMGVADGIVEADGEVIYQVKDMKVALSES